MLLWAMPMSLVTPADDGVHGQRERERERGKERRSREYAKERARR